MTLNKIPRSAIVLSAFVAALAAVVVAAQRAVSAPAMTTAATKFLDGLSPELRQKASFPLDAEDRTRWHYVPTSQHPRHGVPIKEMSEAQRALARGLLQAAMSQRGYLTATAIMDLETILRAIESAARGGTAGQNRDPELYFFSIFGTPSPKGVWGWRVEGHHLSLHFTLANNSATANSPAFYGTNPAEVRDGEKKGLRILGDLEDTARALVLALDDTQRASAIFSAKAPGDIVTTTAVKIDPLSPAGLLASAMTPKQRELLMAVIGAYTTLMPNDTAADRLAKIKQAGIEKIGFAWAGDTTRGQQHYYRVQGPTFLIEFDNVQNNGNHVHSVWRDFNGDFGRDLLREHLKVVPHF
jgi:Protein of unknown function (DUF3500)